MKALFAVLLALAVPSAFAQGKMDMKDDMKKGKMDKKMAKKSDMKKKDKMMMEKDGMRGEVASLSPQHSVLRPALHPHLGPPPSRGRMFFVTPHKVFVIPAKAGIQIAIWTSGTRESNQQ